MSVLVGSYRLATGLSGHALGHRKESSTNRVFLENTNQFHQYTINERFALLPQSSSTACYFTVLFHYISVSTPHQGGTPALIIFHVSLGKQGRRNALNRSPTEEGNNERRVLICSLSSYMTGLWACRTRNALNNFPIGTKRIL